MRMKRMHLTSLQVPQPHPYKKKPPARAGGFLAPQKEFESPTFRLGGGRSVQLSYWGIAQILYPNYRKLSINSGRFFYILCIYWWKSHLKGESNLNESQENCMDIDDLIFSEEDGGPSER